MTARSRTLREILVALLLLPILLMLMFFVLLKLVAILVRLPDVDAICPVVNLLLGLVCLDFLLDPEGEEGLVADEGLDDAE